jgi:hypothetical protein
MRKGLAGLSLLVACRAAPPAGSVGSSGGGVVQADTAQQAETAGGDTAATDAAAADSAVPGVTAPDIAAPDIAAPDTAKADTATAPKCDPNDLGALFQKKIKPLVTKGQPTTCNQCHLSGVDLGMFVQETPCKSMACMKEKGMVDFSDPKASQVLAWIAKAKPQSELITTDVQANEHKAFYEWIHWSSQCHASTCGDIQDPCGAGAQPPPPVDKPMLGGCDETSLADAFDKLVYKWRDRCSHCHAPYGKDHKSSGAPGWLHQDPGAGGSLYTMYGVLGLPGLPGQPVINTAKPVDSLWLRKPLHKASIGGVTHGGGQKYKNTADETYQDSLKWIQLYAACKNK